MVKYWVLLVLCLFLMPGCRELVQDEFERFDRVPVVNSVIVAGNEISLHVSYTGSLGDTAISVVPNANISLLRNGVFVENMEYAGEGYYSSQTIAEAGNCYSCEITIPGFETITCGDSLPEAVEITDIKYDSWVGTDTDGRAYSSITFTFANDQGIPQFFQVQLTYNEIFRNEISVRNITYPLLDITDPIISGGGIPIAVFSDENIEGDSYRMTLSFYGSRSQPISMEFRTLSCDYYRYLRNEYLYDLSRYPEDILSVVPGFNLYSNITGGYGIFAGYSVFVVDSINKKYQ